MPGNFDNYWAHYSSIAGLLYNEIVSRIARFLLVFSLFLGFLALPASVAAQDETSHYFAETGHSVSGDFWQFYKNFPNAQTVFGFPLTEAFTDAESGRQIQYFNRARFEFHPEYPAGQRVLLSPLGENLYVSGGPALNLYTPIGCRSFANGKAVCYAFLEFFDANGGEAVFGMPISGFEFANGRIVQYFQRARFEWFPEFPEGQKVVLADLGRIYFDLIGEDPNLLTPVRPDNQTRVISLQARAFVWKAVTQPNDTQTVYVVVQDQTLSPVRDAVAVVTIYWTNGTPQSISLPTNEYGVIILPFQVTGQPYGSLVTVKVDVYYGDLTASSLTSFRIWQ